MNDPTAKLLAALKSIQEEADHGIPFYAYGDNEAACSLSNRLETIRHAARDAIQPLPPSAEEASRGEDLAEHWKRANYTVSHPEKDFSWYEGEPDEKVIKDIVRLKREGKLGRVVLDEISKAHVPTPDQLRQEVTEDMRILSKSQPKRLSALGVEVQAPVEREFLEDPEALNSTFADEQAPEEKAVDEQAEAWIRQKINTSVTSATFVSLLRDAYVAGAATRPSSPPAELREALQVLRYLRSFPNAPAAQERADKVIAEALAKYGDAFGALNPPPPQPRES